MTKEESALELVRRLCQAAINPIDAERGRAVQTCFGHAPPVALSYVHDLFFNYHLLEKQWARLRDDEGCPLGASPEPDDNGRIGSYPLWSGRAHARRSVWDTFKTMYGDDSREAKVFRAWLKTAPDAGLRLAQSLLSAVDALWAGISKAIASVH